MDVEILLYGDKSLNVTKIRHTDATYEITGNYLIVTDSYRYDEDVREKISHPYDLGKIKKYKIIHNNK